MTLGNEYWEYSFKEGYLRLDKDPVWDTDKIEDFKDAYKLAGYSTSPTYEFESSLDARVEVFYAQKSTCTYKFIVVCDFPDINYFFLKDVPSALELINKIINPMKLLNS